MLKNAKHEAVISAYIANSERVGWKAYQSVYPKSSQRAAETAWSRLMKNAEFSARHDELVKTITEKAVSTAVMDLNEVLEELSKLGRSNLQNVIVDGDTTADVVQRLREMAPEHAAAIKALTIETYIEGSGDDAREVKKLKVELHDKKGALGLLLGHFVPQKHELTGKDGNPIETKDVSEPLNEIELARRIAFALELGARQAGPAKKAAATTPAKPKASKPKRKRKAKAKAPPQAAEPADVKRGGEIR